MRLGRLRRRRARGLSLDSVRALGRKTFAPGLRGICQGARDRSSVDQYSIREAVVGRQQNPSANGLFAKTVGGGSRMRGLGAGCQLPAFSDDS